MQKVMCLKWIEKEGEEPGKHENAEIIQTRFWMLICAFMIMPGLNLLVLLLMAFRNKEIHPASLVNFARGMLIVWVLVAIIGTACYFLFRGAFAQIVN